MTGRLLSTARTTTRALASRRVRSVLVALALPLLIVCAYFAGIAGADARTQAIPALVVNNDEMVMQTAADGTQTPVIAGRLVVSELTSPDVKTGFSWGLANEETAQQALENGDAYVVVVIPKDFSASVASLANGTPEAAQVSIMTDRSHDYLSPSVAGALSAALTAQFGTTLTEQVAIALVSGVEQTALALHQAADGASGIATGGNQLADGLGQYTTGVSQLADGASQLAANGPQLSSGVRDYTDGVSQLSAGIGPYTQGVSELSAGIAAMDEKMPDLRAGGEGLQTMSQQLSGVGSALSGAASTYRDQIRPELEAISAAGAGLDTVCDPIDDQTAAEQCRAAMTRITDATGGVDGLIEQLDTAADTADGAKTTIKGLGDLGAGVVGVADGVHDLSTGAAKLAAGGPALADGASQLAAGGPALADGVDQYTGGVDQVSSGASQLSANGPQLKDGASQLATGATQLSDGLREGADKASQSVGDPNAFANVMAHPVDAVVDARHDPGFGGIVAAVFLPVGVWLAALGTMLARRVLAPGALASSASTGRLVRLAVRRAAPPVGIAVVVLAVAAHTWLGVPWLALGGTLLFGILMAVACVGLHLLFTVLWGRRLGALVSIALLAVQLLAVRGFVPLELLSPFVSAISGVFPASYATSGLQLVYAGGSGGAVLSSVVGLVLIGALSFGALSIALAAKRRTRVAALLPAGGLPTAPRRAPA